MLLNCPKTILDRKTELWETLEKERENKLIDKIQ